jgi:endonuclease I
LKYLFKFIFIFFCSSLSTGQIPSYYQNINLNLTGDQLKNELSSLITTTHQNLIEYTSSNSIDTWDIVKSSDVFALDTSKVLLVYGYNDNDATVENDRTRAKSLSCHTSSCFGLWNREHVFPKSLASPNLVTNFPGAGTDVHNLRACDYSTNASRSNKKFDAGNGNSSSNNQGNWYPGDEWKGDVARIIMYMYLRYPNQCEPTNVGIGTQLFSPNGDMPDVFLNWNSSDPVSEFEETRNNSIANVQGNRNPFIDNPYLATLIWNGPAAEDKWASANSITDYESGNFELKINPFNNEIIIENSDLTTFLYLELINMKGQIIKFTRDNILRTQDLDSGVYILKITTKHKSYLRKVSLN